MINISLVENENEFASYLEDIINKTEELNCLGAYRDYQSLLDDPRESRPDVVLMDIELDNGISGVDGVPLVKSRWPDCEVIMLTMFDNNDYVFNSLQNGANGYLLKDIKPRKLTEAIKEVINGGAPMSMAIARMVSESFKKKPPPEELTYREQEVLDKLRRGLSYRAIADDLYISIDTVKFHIKNIYKKLHVKGRNELMSGW